MRSVSPDYAAACLPELLRAVSAGEEVEIVDQGRPVARLVPPREMATNGLHEDEDAPSEEVEQAFHGD
jgi:prevent-host-death family protein